MRIRYPIALILSMLLQSPCPAGVSCADGLEDLNRAEDQFFELKARGRYNEALDRLKEHLSSLIRMHSTADQPLKDELEARGECYLLWMNELTLAMARYREIHDFLSEVLPENMPLVRDLGREIRLNLLKRLGDLEGAEALRRALGYIDDWWIVGPFDNERGGGFDIEYGPEKGIDLAAEYDGKVRTVTWRRLPTLPTTGRVDLNSLFNPRDQSLAYALTFIISDREQDAALRMGSDEAMKVFLDGRLLHAFSGRRPLHFDQDHMGLRLRQGVNALLVKVCDQTGPWAFAARLTTPSGAALSGIRVTADPQQFSPRPDDLEPVAVSGGARAFFEERVAAGESRAHFYLGMLHLAREYEGEDAGLAGRHLGAFLEVEPDHVYGRFLAALAEARRVEARAELDDNAWRRGLEHALEADPKLVEAHLLLGKHYLKTLFVPDKAMTHARAALEANPDNLPAHYLLADLLEARDLDVLARKGISRLGKREDLLRYPGLRIRLGDLDLEERRIDRARGHWEAALEIDHLSHGARNRLIEHHIQSGNVVAARKLLEDRLALDPLDLAALKGLARLARGEGDFNAAVKWLSRALEIRPEDDGAMESLGAVHHHERRRDEARHWFTEALRINPKNKDLRRYVEFLFEDEKPFEDRHAVDVLVLLAAHPQEPNPENDSHEYLLLQDVVKVNPDGTSSHYHHQVVRILNHEGAKRFDYFVRLYQPGEQRSRIKTARVIHPDGSIEEAKIDNNVRSGDARFGGRAPAFVDLPPLKPGDVVDVDIRIDDLRQSFFGDYFGYRHEFQPGDLKRIREARLSLILPKARTFRFHQRNTELKPEREDLGEDYETLTWTLSDIPKVNPERNMPGRGEYAPCVEVTTYGSWDDFGKWWWNLVEKQCDLSEAMKEKVAELTEGLETERDKTRAIYNFVVSDIRYNDTWEFGVHGFKPYRASSIFNNRFGDCKDTALLLKSLLGAAGIKAFPVIIKLELPRSREDLTLPMVSHFNHAITYVPELDGGPGLYLDGTAQFHAMDSLPAADRGATVFIVEDGPGRIATIPYAPPSEHFRENIFSVDIDENGGATILQKHRSGGLNAVHDRQRFLVEGKREALLEQRFGGVLGDVVIGETGFSNMENLDEPVAYHARVKATELLLRSGDAFQLRSVFFPLSLGGMATEEERKFDLLLGLPHHSVSEIRYRLPDTVEVEALPENSALDNELAAFSMTWSQGDDGLIVVRRSYTLKTPRVASLSYPLFRDFCREAERAERRMIRIAKKR